MAQIFRVHSVDLLGNGMSGALLTAASPRSVTLRHNTFCLGFWRAQERTVLACQQQSTAPMCTSPDHHIGGTTRLSSFLHAGRPTFRAKSREDAEGFFLTALDRWREAIGIDKMVLVGHSLGGYLAATYALQHPQHVQHLVLVCPAGVVSPSHGHTSWGMLPACNVCSLLCLACQCCVVSGGADFQGAAYAGACCCCCAHLALSLWQASHCSYGPLKASVRP